MKTSAKTKAKIDAIKSLKGPKAFNLWAQQAYREKDAEALMLAAWNLAERGLSYRRGPKAKAHERVPASKVLRGQALMVGATAGIEKALAWTEGDFYKDIGAAIYNAMQDHLRAGGRYEDVTWRGDYNTHTRRFRSGDSEYIVLLNTSLLEDSADTDIGAVELEGTDLGASAVESRLDQQSAATEQQAAYRAEDKGTGGVATGTGEHIDHGAGDDSERLNPKDDGETAYGIDGATRGLFTGKAVPDGQALAVLHASERLYAQDLSAWALLNKIDRAGSFDNYVNAGRKHVRAAWEKRYADALRAFNEILSSIDSDALIALEAPAGFMRAEGEGFVSEEVSKDKFVGRRPVLVDTPEGVSTEGRSVIGLRPDTPRLSKMRGRSWQPKILFASRWLTVRTVFDRGHNFAHAVKTNRRSRLWLERCAADARRYGPLFRFEPHPLRSLLDYAEV